MKAIYSLVFILFVVKNPVHSQGSRQNYQTESQSNFNDGLLVKYYKMNHKSAETAASKNISNSLPIQKIGISAWAIIAIILSIIVFSTIMYYVVILYPFICKKDQTYNIIELTEINSVCTVSDNANNMPLYHSSNDISNDISLNQ